MRHYQTQLMGTDGLAISQSGGKAYITVAGGTAKATLYTAAGLALVNPVSLTNGMLEFWTADTVSSVDLYVQGPSGHFNVYKAQAPALDTSLVFPKGAFTMMTIPFSIADTTAATETDTGFDLPTNGKVLPIKGGVDVLTLDAGITMDVGILASESGGSANGLYKAVSVASAVHVTPTVVVTSGVYASTTKGAFIADFVVGTNTDDRGLYNLREYVCNGTAKSISYTLSSGSDTAAGFIRIPLIISNL